MADAKAVCAAGADAIGINFFEGSKRFCSPEAAAEIVSALSASVTVIGVFVDADRSRIARTIELTGIGGLQLHGRYSAEDAGGWDLPVIRAVEASSHEAVRRALDEARAAGTSSRVLVDSPAGGGSGLRWAPETVAGLDLSDAIIAGGLEPSNVAEAVASFDPWGVDSASGTESAPGVKDPRLIEEFVANARAA